MRGNPDMRVLLVSASYPTPYTFHSKFLGLAYLHANALADPVIARRVAIEHVFHDTRLAAAGRIAEEIAAARPDLAGFGCYVWNTPDVLEIVRLLKRLSPETKIVLGGPEVDAAPLQVLEKNPAVDFVSKGEGEENFRELLRALLEDRDPATVPGMALRGRNGPVEGSPRPPVKDLDVYPSPFLEGVLDLEEGKRGAYFQTTRGCPFGCTYCDYGRNRPYSEFSSSRVESEIAWFRARNARILFCVDATFNLKKDRAVKILDAIADEDLKAVLWLEAHPDLLDDAFMAALSRVHKVFLGLGLQTTNSVAMKNIRRRWDPDRTARLLDRLAGQKNCHASLELIMGLPGDNLETYKESLTWVYRREPANVFAFILEVLPMAPMRQEMERFQIKDGGPDSLHEILSNYSFPADQIQAGKAMTEWNRLLQPVFYRLVRLTGLPAGEIIEQWGWHAYHGGLHDALPDLRKNRIDLALLDRAAALFDSFLPNLFAKGGCPDLSLPMREFFRYYFLRRAVTDERAVFVDSMDVHAITLDPQDNRILAKGSRPEGARPPEAIEADFAYDMARLWPMVRVEAMTALERSPRRYLFFTGPRGAAEVMEL